MKKITLETVRHVADLARLDLDPAQMDQLAAQIDGILDYVDTLNQVDTEGIAPTCNVIQLVNAFREDELQPSLDRQEALLNAPDQENGQFVVPRVIE
jgi:aspartyl-tRNA(Asn)/glutamyl-tRNA(Gln) amidotransferase subunit C